MSVLRVSVLGPVRAFLGDDELGLGPARQRAVFAVLAAAGRVVSRDELIGDVWGASPPTTAAGSIYTYISGLRRVLGKGVLTSTSAGYVLRLERDDLDSERFDRLTNEASALRDPAQAAAVLDDALRLWHGEAYAGMAGHRLELERSRLAERRLAAAEQRARLLTGLGDDGVVAELSALVRDHPLHEPLYEILMTALDRAGRQTEALEVFERARRVFETELGVSPGPALVARRNDVQGKSVVVEKPVLAGREDETQRLRALVQALIAGRGAAVWIEGEPGIGKTELLTAAFSDAGELGCRIAWGSAEERDDSVPAQAVTRALGLRNADRVLAHVRAVCAEAPLILIVDGLQRADEASLPFWDQLVAATRRLPLLLVAAARLEPAGRELARLRRGVQARQGHVLALGALPGEAVERLVSGLVGASLGDRLAAVVPAAAGNPLYAREMTTALLRRGAVFVKDGRADIDESVALEAPRSVLALLRSTVDLLSSGAQEVLRTAALLGPEFAVDDLVAVTGQAPFDVVSHLEEALAASVVVASGTDLAFRQPFLRQALYESIPAQARAMLHRHTAEVLDRGGSSAVRVAAQLADSSADAWVVSWLVAHVDEVARRAPSIAGGLLRRALDVDRHPDLLIALVKLDFREGRRPLDEAREAVKLATDPADRAEMRQLLATMTYQRGEGSAATRILQDALLEPDVPPFWQTRHRVLLHHFRRGPLDDLDRADSTAEQLYAEAVAADLPYQAVFALQTRWMTDSIRRDHERALEYADRALDVMRDHPSFAGLYFDLLDNRVFSLQNLDRFEEAERTLREGALFAIRHRLPSSLPVAAAVQHYWSGRWDNAVAEVGTVTDDAGSTILGMREQGAVAMLLHGLAALIAARRQDPVLAGGHLDSAQELPTTRAERENCDFMLVARALLHEQSGHPDEALHVLGPLLAPAYAPLMLRHQWLPYLTRLALSLGRRDVAARAAAVCAEEAALEVRPARAAMASLRCQALVNDDPALALSAAGRCRAAGRLTELAGALEDAAVLLAAGRRPLEAARAGNEALELYVGFGASWDLRRLRRRLSEYGVEPAGEPCQA